MEQESMDEVSTPQNLFSSFFAKKQQDDLHWAYYLFKLLELKKFLLLLEKDYQYFFCINLIMIRENRPFTGRED